MHSLSYPLPESVAFSQQLLEMSHVLKWDINSFTVLHPCGKSTETVFNLFYLGTYHLYFFSPSRKTFLYLTISIFGRCCTFPPSVILSSLGSSLLSVHPYSLPTLCIQVPSFFPCVLSSFLISLLHPFPFSSSSAHLNPQHSSKLDFFHTFPHISRAKLYCSSLWVLYTLYTVNAFYLIASLSLYAQL